jgi:ankyrin repeat protein
MNHEFFGAVKQGDAMKVAAMIKEDPSLLADKDEQGLGPYTVARYSRQDEVSRLLLEKGVELDIFAACLAGVSERVVDLLAADRGLVNSYSHDGWTPLHLAAFFGRPEIAEILLANGADVDARSKNQMRNTPLHAAVAGKRTDIASVLLNHGAEVNATQHGGWTPLHAAAQNGDVELARLLISLGADVKARAENNQTALDLALTKGHPAVVELLEQHGAD